MVSEDDEEKYNNRIKTDLENGKIHCCLNNAQMKYKEYRIKFRDIIKNLEYNLITNLINRKDDNGINSFIISCLCGYDELVALFISVGADVDCKNGFFTLLTAACHDGHLHTVEILLNKGSNINQTNIHTETPLYTACFEGHYNLVNLLIDKEADINKQNKYRHTPLYASCLTGHETIVSLLIDNGAKLSQCEDCLIVASLGGHKKIIEKLLLSGCGINSVDTKGKTALFIACEEGFTNIVKLLIDNNADILKVNSNGETPLHAACCVDNNDIVSVLISNDADVNMIDVDFETPIHKACRNGSLCVIQTLLNCGADTHKLNREEHTFLFGKHRGDIKTAQSLIRNRADVNMKTDSGEMPLVAACQQGHGFLIQLLLEEGADVNEALCCVVQEGYDRTIKMLLYKGGNVDCKGVDEKSLLALTCEKGSTKAVKFLLEKGADFRKRDVNGKTLLHVACNTGNFDLVQILIDKGLDLTIHDKNGRFPLYVSMHKGFNDLSKHLIEKNCPIAISEEDRKTALISVFESGNMKISKLLVINGYTETLSNFNETVLYYPYKLDLSEEVAILRRNDIKEKYKYGYTPMILADIAGNDDLSEYLLNLICSIRNTSISNDCIEHSITKEHAYLNATIDNRLSLQEYEYLFQACMTGEDKSGILEKLTPSNIFDIFIKPGEPNVSIWFEQTPLCLAIRRGHTEVAKALIKHGVDVDLTFEDWSDEKDPSLSKTIQYGYTPLFAACQREYNEIVCMLLARGANLNKALYDACREGYLDTVQFLLHKGAGVNSISRYNQTALFGACIGVYSSIVKFLIDQGAVIDNKCRHKDEDTNEITCLYAAYLHDNHNQVQLLISRGADVNAVGNFGRTLLHDACRERNYKIIELLVYKGVDINVSDMFGATPLLACLLQNEEEDLWQKDFIEGNSCFPFDLDKWDPVNIISFCKLQENYVEQWTRFKPLLFGRKYKSLTEDHYKVIQLLVENSADINKAEKKGRTPLAFARETGDTRTKGYDEIVKLLINHGADYNYHCNRDGKTPLYSACKLGFNTIAEILIANGADVYEIEETGKTLLPVTITIYLFQLLIGISSDLNKPDCFGRYPLYESMINGVDDISDYLLHKDCPIAIVEGDKKTALISVFERGNTDLTRLVVSKGYTNGIANFNETILHNAYRLADIAGNDDLSEYLIQKGFPIARNDDLSEYLITQDFNYGLRYSVRCSENNETVYITRTGDHKQIITENICDEYKYLFQVCMTGRVHPWRKCVDQNPFAKRKLHFFFRSKERNGSFWFTQTPLCLTSRMGRIEAVKLLLQYGAEVDKMSEDVKNDYGFSMTF
ncbi:unnamed protein product [Mytilus coruscus]|uniref:ANK n=1 Tax=Mytilus coruscus TaxID=42192 RepID=A0A6J8BHL1_MYTCO|nr:unnamed protein product [Mytilus coruscus]